jgi:hypothetical protein
MNIDREPGKNEQLKHRGKDKGNGKGVVWHTWIHRK